MLCISVKEFLIWKKKQLSKGGDQQSFSFLLDCIGGISTSDLNSLTINPEKKLYLKKNLDYLESIWDNYLLNSTPIQYLCGVTFWRDLKLRVTDKVLIPRPETELIVDVVKNLSKDLKKKKINILDVGTGSACIIITITLLPFDSGGWKSEIPTLPCCVLKAAS